MRKLFLVLVILVVASFAGRNDLLVGYHDTSYSGVATNIGGDPFYDSVTYEDWRSYTPTVDHLDEFGCVFVWTNYNPPNPGGLGDNLADYVDNGGTVVFSDFCWTGGWGVEGRIMTDENYMPMTHDGSGAFTNTNLGDYDDTHEFMDGVSSINGIYYWTYTSLEGPATWVADNTSSTIYCAVNEDFNCVGVNMFPGDPKRWTGDGWVLYNNIIQNLMCMCYVDDDPPFVDEMDPADGETDVPVDSVIVFHCRDYGWGVDTDTIDFTAQDTTLLTGRAVSPSVAMTVGYDPNRTIPGDLDIDDADPQDAVCTFTPDEDLNGNDTITCTVAAGLADRHGFEMEEDFVWAFTTEDVPKVEQTTWGAIKAEF